MAVLRALIAVALITGCLVGPVYAQKPERTLLQQEDDMKKKDAEAIDRQYKSTLDRTRKAKTDTPATDPWQSMRGPDDSKTKR